MKNNNGKKNISLLMASALAFALCSCGSNSTSDKKESVGTEEKSVGALEDAHFDEPAGADAGVKADTGARGDSAINSIDIDGAPSKSDIAGESFGDYVAEADGGGAYESAGDVGTPVEIEIEQEEGKVGALTAGLWNDNNNWGFFKNLVNSDIIDFPSYGLDPTHRIKVTVENDGAPVVNDVVTLMYNDEPVWKSVTDKDGVAYVFWDGETTGMYNVVAFGTDVPYQLDLKSEDGEQGSSNNTEEATLYSNAEINTRSKLEVMFIVDTTGSMGDEMLYLQKDLAAIADEVGDSNTYYSINFYKDNGEDEEYVTNCHDFTNNIDEVVKLISDEYASGGGDTPEAVSEILAETMDSAKWSDDSVKVAFLVFDAPPHDEKEDIKRIQTAIKNASELGVRLVPVVASNTDRETELFARALAIMTNGEYVFITGDSGIGGEHLEPIIGDFEVRSLHDILVDVIKEYKQ